MILTMSDSQRRNELTNKFAEREGWADGNEFRLQEKEDDAARIIQKLLNQIDSLKSNTSLLAIPNNLLMEVLNKLSEMTLEVDSEARRRE